jgi:D-serine deaminase-like pyridoxal phosphate-dependent protein
MLETPCVVIDPSVMRRNIENMAELAKRNGVELRPHIKTHKIPEFAKEQIQAGSKGITVAKRMESMISSSPIQSWFLRRSIGLSRLPNSTR